ncbi:hypothetical protein FIBSPDRAFT_1037438 [Athelia psychrophila]|uniref:MYND-type domain-containing protein n=1 Tax=Athelia psychrophila TaxID=1759441 RepID=A0A166U8S2_9AGAM|nr:hypothetical protein FIBSPDRAFT_1037438 [Fibularhizoctonia sp. CBS 109695]
MSAGAAHKNLILHDCSNPTCKFALTVQKVNSPKNCSRCRSARYCDTACQKAHWPAHKEFCNVWSATSADAGGEITVAEIKKKMGDLIWLVRGMPEYVDYLFKEYLYRKSQGLRGCMEFEFENAEGLLKAVEFIKKQPVTEKRLFCGMPGTPSYRLSDTSGNVPQEIKIRKVKPGQEMSFVKNVDDYMHFTENENRPNLQRSLDMAGDSKSLLVISVSVKLQGTYSSHQYDFLYSGLSFYPEIN